MAWAAIAGAVVAGLGSARKDKTDYGQLVLFGQFHEAKSLAIALGTRHPEVNLHVFLKGSALLVAD